jgi:indolepyruvate ferredoxin oxidoreductase alpha subunit
MAQEITGSQALAMGAIEAGVQFVTGYPGAPSTSVVDALLQLASDRLRIEWAINEKSAFDAALGGSLAGIRSLLCLKSVGLNVALDSLMVSNLAAGDGGFVLLVGDDPGGWGSQNEQDSRPLAAAAEVPLLEPTSLADAPAVMHQAFELSERFRVPVAVRITRALVVDRTEAHLAHAPAPRPRAGVFKRQGDRFNVLPIHVVDLHRRLQGTLGEVQALFEDSPLNGGGEEKASRGVIAAGYSYQKLAQVLDQANHPPLRILRLATLHPLPERRIHGFSRDLESILVLEETAPYVEIQVQALAQRLGQLLPVYGRRSGHLPGAGELFAAQIAQALMALQPEWPWPSFEQASRAMPSRRPLCDDCPYVPIFETLLAVMERHGGRDAFIVTGEPGCMVRAQLPPWELLDVKYGMGSSIGLAAGLARSGVGQKIVALSGDSALLHSGFGELIDAVQTGIHLLVVVLANETTALSGGQPHPGTARDALGHPRTPVDLAALVKAAGVASVHTVDPLDHQATETTFENALTSNRLVVVIARRACPEWEGKARVCTKWPG